MNDRKMTWDELAKENSRLKKYQSHNKDYAAALGIWNEWLNDDEYRNPNFDQYCKEHLNQQN